MIQRVEAGRELGQPALADLGKALPELLKQGVTEVYLDASRVGDFNSASLEAVLEFDALAQSRGLMMSVVTPSEVFATALVITGLADRITVRDQAGNPMSGEELLASFVDVGATEGLS